MIFSLTVGQTPERQKKIRLDTRPEIEELFPNNCKALRDKHELLIKESILASFLDFLSLNANQTLIAAAFQMHQVAKRPFI